MISDCLTWTDWPQITENYIKLTSVVCLQFSQDFSVSYFSHRIGIFSKTLMSICEWKAFIKLEDFIEAYFCEQIFLKRRNGTDG